MRLGLKVQCKLTSFDDQGPHDSSDHVKRLQQFLQHKKTIARYNRLLTDFPYKHYAKRITPEQLEHAMKEKWGKTLHIDVEDRTNALSVVISGVPTSPTSYIEVCQTLTEKGVGANFLELLSRMPRSIQTWTFLEVVLDNVVDSPRECEWDLD